MVQLKQITRDNGTFVYAEDENGNCYEIIYRQNERDSFRCDGALLAPTVSFDASKFEITDVQTQHKPS